MPTLTEYGYEVIRELGANRGAGRVAYLARQIDIQKLVVIKEFQFANGGGWDGHKAIDREIKILQQLKHLLSLRFQLLPYLQLHLEFMLTVLEEQQELGVQVMLRAMI